MYCIDLRKTFTQLIYYTNLKYSKYGICTNRILNLTPISYEMNLFFEFSNLLSFDVVLNKFEIK